MQNKPSKDIAPGVTFLVLAIVLYVLMPSQIKDTTESAFTARTFPTIVLAIIGLCALILILQGMWKIIRAKRKMGASSADGTVSNVKRGNMPMFLGVVGLMVACAVIGRFTSLLVSGLLLGAGFLTLYRDKKAIHYVIVLSAVTVSYFLFKQVFGLQLP